MNTTKFKKARCTPPVENILALQLYEVIIKSPEKVCLIDKKLSCDPTKYQHEIISNILESFDGRTYAISKPFYYTPTKSIENIEGVAAKIGHLISNLDSTENRKLGLELFLQHHQNLENTMREKIKLKTFNEGPREYFSRNEDISNFVMYIEKKDFSSRTIFEMCKLVKKLDSDLTELSSAKYDTYTKKLFQEYLEE
jgi:hypothetical protein